MINGIKTVDGFNEEYFDFLNSNLSINKNENDDEIWQPIQNISDEGKQETITATENALKEIEQDNGYAAKKPAERNAVINALKLWNSIGLN